MRIVWSSDAAQDLIRQMREAEQNMADCLMRAGESREALDEANPGAESKTLNKLTKDFEQTIRHLEQTAQELRELIRKTEKAKANFEDAENDIGRLIENISTGAGSVSAAAATAVEAVWDRGVPVIEWTLPKPLVLPMMRTRNSIPAPVWLEDLLNDPALFHNLI